MEEFTIFFQQTLKLHEYMFSLQRYLSTSFRNCIKTKPLQVEQSLVVEDQNDMGFGVALSWRSSITTIKR